MATAPESTLSDFLLLPELVLIEARPKEGWILCERQGKTPSCSHCGFLGSIIYDRRVVRVKDLPLRAGGLPIRLLIRKRRFKCRSCRRLFSETIAGIIKHRRSTERFRSLILWACQRFSSMKQVCQDFRVSSDFVYQAHYEQLELLRKKNNQYPWPEQLGIDDNCVGRNRETHSPAFVTMLVNHNRKKLMEVAFGKSTQELVARLAHIPGRENVRMVTLDMSDAYRNFAKTLFPNAELIADKFHVLRLLSPILLKERRKIAGTNANRRARKYLLCSSKHLDYFDRLAISRYLESFPRLKELYEFKERLHSLYRIKGYQRAKLALEHLCSLASVSKEPEIKRLGRTLQNWSQEILNYFKYRLTNARVEGFNNTASLVRRRAYGYRNLNNLRLKLLSVCG